MFPSHMANVSNHRHQEHIDHAARINELTAARRHGVLDLDRGAARRSTARRLADMLAAARAAVFPRPAVNP